jgi:hypothetical protein
MNVTVIGSGGLGGYYGGMLANAGHRVTFVARGAHLEALRRQGGVQLRTVHGEFFARGDVTDDPVGGPPPDLVLFTVKSFDTQEAATRLGPAAGPKTAILSMQNGVENEEILVRMFGADRVLGGNVYLLATIQAPGIVEQTGGPRILNFGEWRGGMSDRARRLEAALKEAGLNATASDDIVREKWVKYALICAQAGMTGRRPGPRRESGQSGGGRPHGAGRETGTALYFISLLRPDPRKAPGDRGPARDGGAVRTRERGAHAGLCGRLRGPASPRPTRADRRPAGVLAAGRFRSPREP